MKSMNNKVQLETILNNKLKLTKREKQILDATYDYAFQIWVVKWWEYLMGSGIAEGLLKKEIEDVGN
jgi:hypothetical protein